MFEQATYTMAAVRTAGLPRRLGAIAYDALLLGAVWWCMGLLAVALAGGEEVRPPYDDVLAIALVLAAYLYFVAQWVRGGQTLGMKAWRIRLRGESGEPVSWGSASVRFASAIIAWLPLGLGYWWSLIDPERRAWHDRWSHTRLLVPTPPTGRALR